MSDYIIRGGRPGYERLQLLARARWPDTRAFFERIGVAPGMKCLDLGCGSGDVTVELARLVGSDGHVTGLDMDGVKIELARERAANQGLANVDFVSADVTRWREERVYDLVYCRFLLQHLREPLDLLRRMWEAVRPEGAVAVEDCDFDGLFCDPANDGFEFYKCYYSLALERRGGDPAVGRKLHRYFREVSGDFPGLTLVHPIYPDGEGKVIAFLTLQASADAIVSEGLAAREEVDAALETLRTFSEDPSTLVAEPRIFQVFSVRSVL